MRKLLSMIKKEFIEIIKNFKLLSICILFIILGALQPITYYYLPDILELAEMPEGTIFQMPPATPATTMEAVFGQFNQIGILILVLIVMGSVASEVKSGVADTVLTKPIPISYYLLSKWVVYVSLTIFSTFLGVLIGWFYTDKLIGSISSTTIIQTTLIDALYLTFFVCLTLLLSSVLKSGILAGAISIISAVVLSLITMLPFNFWYLPSNLLLINQKILYDVEISNYYSSLTFNILYIILMFLLSVIFFKKVYTKA